MTNIEIVILWNLVKRNDPKTIHVFCPTRWVVRGETSESVLKNHTELLELWEWSQANVNDTGLERRTIGVNFVIKSFNYFTDATLKKLY